jgi:hypothetical protein
VKAAALIGALAATAVAHAAPDAARAPLLLVVQAEAARFVPATALGERLANDLGLPVRIAVAPATATTRGLLTIDWDVARQRLILTYRDAGGDEISRSLGGAHDQAASLEAVALVAANLIRNEAEELLCALAHPRAAAAPPAPPSPVVVASDAPPATEDIVISRRRAPAPGRATAHPWSFGALAYLSSRSAEPVYTPGSGFYVARTVGRHFALGLTDLMMFPNEGQTVISGGPYGEGFWFAKDWLQLFSQLGVPLQGRWGGNQRAAFGAQPFFGAGLRFWIGGRISIAAAARVGVVASPAFGTPPTGLVQGTVTASGGLELGFHL